MSTAKRETAEQIIASFLNTYREEDNDPEYDAHKLVGALEYCKYQIISDHKAPAPTESPAPGVDQREALEAIEYKAKTIFWAIKHSPEMEADAEEIINLATSALAALKGDPREPTDQTPPAPTWTREKPTREGWYWFKWDKHPDYFLSVFVRVLRTDGEPVIFVEESTDQSVSDVCVSGLKGKWCGPLAEPGEEKEEGNE